MKKFSDNQYVDALAKTGIILVIYHVVLLIVGLSMESMVLPLEVHLQNPYLILSAVVVLYLVVLFIVKRTVK
jgi:hypothetical protein